MLKSLADLPSDLGLEAVEKFGMASLETVRSKTGFMARPLHCCQRIAEHAVVLTVMLEPPASTACCEYVLPKAITCERWWCLLGLWRDRYTMRL